jgi:RNA-binding protein
VPRETTRARNAAQKTGPRVGRPSPSASKRRAARRAAPEPGARRSGAASRAQRGAALERSGARGGSAGPRAASDRPAARASEPLAAPVLSSRARSELRARAHHLQPIVQVGHEGLHASVLDAVRRALRDHELIKVRLHEPEDKRAMAEALASQTHAALCGLVGHTVILYRPKPRGRQDW